MMFEIGEEEGRLDVVLSQILEKSRSKVEVLIKDGYVLVNGKKEKRSYQVKMGDSIFVSKKEEEEINLIPSNIPLDIIFEDSYMLIINKQSGLVVHPAPGHKSDTLVNALLYHYKIEKDDTLRPGIVHRLDKDTSGLMMVAKTEDAKEKLSLMLKKKEVKRTYLALVDGVILHDTGEIDAPIGRDPNNRQKMKVTKENAKDAITHFKVIKRYQKHTLVECVLDTGRTHQIRVHFEYINHPVTNDLVYGNHKNTTSFGQLLHSKKIELIEPITKEKLVFEVDPPKEFLDYLTQENL